MCQKTEEKRRCFFIGQDMKRLFSKPYLYIAFVVSLLLLLHPFKDVFSQKPRGSFIQFLSVPFATSDYTPFAAIFCVLPFAASFCEDYNSGYARFIAMRIGTRRYAFQRCITVCLSGGILMSAVVSTVIFICALLANEPETAQTTAFLRSTIWARMGIVTLYGGSLFVALKIILGFLFGAVWALIGLVISVLFINQYITIIGPFVIYQILWFLLEGSAFNPVYLLRGDSNYIPSLSFIFIYQGISIAACFGASYAGIEMRMKT